MPFIQYEEWTVERCSKTTSDKIERGYPEFKSEMHILDFCKTDTDSFFELD